nr:hypothetical protein [Tanacetum cinerariifolium]
MTYEEIEDLVTRRVTEEMEARKAVMNLEPLNKSGDKQEGANRGNRIGENGGNGNRGNGENRNGNGGNRYGGNRENRDRNGERNGNGNKNRYHGINYEGFMSVARKCTFQDFLKCKPHNFLGTEGVVRLTSWFKKLETV